MDNKNKLGANALLIFFVLAFFCIISIIKEKNSPKIESIEFGKFIELVKEKSVTSVVFEGDSSITAQVKDKNSDKMKTVKSVGDTRSELYQKILLENDIIPSYKVPEQPSGFLILLINWLPLIVILICGWFMLSRLQSGMNSARNSITAIKSGPNFGNPITNVTFQDVAGVDEAKEELKEIVDFLKDPKKFTSLGGRLPKGALLIGPPGTGKTLLAKAVAGEAKVPYFSMSGSQFVELYVGVGAGRVRSLFDQARRSSPCIIFIDEIDAIGKHRGSGSMAGGNDEREQTLNQLLVEMDGFEASSGIILLAATNRPDTLDPALLRPGRFDRRVYVSLPDVKGREQILKTHSKKVSLDDSISFESLARGTAGMSGAELENLVNEAAIYAARENKSKVTLYDFERAKDKIIMGVERKSLVISEDEKRTTAYHEIGHTIIAKVVPGIDPFHKVSIIPRGQALGVTQTLPEENKLSLSKQKAESMICMLMGGRAAEEIVFNHFTTGASNDIERASGLAKKMVCEWGMSEKFGARSFYDISGGRMGENISYSSQTLKEIEEEITTIVNRNYDKAKQILLENKELLIALSEELLKKETLDGNDVDEVISSIKLRD